MNLKAYAKGFTLAELAFVCPRLWIYLSLLSNASYDGVYYAVEAIVLLACCVGVVWTRPRPEKRRLWLMLIAVVGGLLPFLSVLADGISFAAGVNLLGCACVMALMYAACAQAYATLPFERAVSSVGISIAVASALYAAISLIPLPIRLLVAAPLPPLCLVLCAKLRKQGAKQALRVESSEGERACAPGQRGQAFILVAYAVTFAVFGFAQGFMRFNFNIAELPYDIVQPIVIVVRTAVPLFVALWFVLRYGGGRAVVLPNMTPALIAVMVALVLVAQQSSQFFAVAYVAGSLVRFLITSTAILLAIVLVKKLSLWPSAALFCLCWGCFSGARSVGMGVAESVLPLAGTTDLILVYSAYLLLAAPLLTVLSLLSARMALHSAGGSERPVTSPSTQHDGGVTLHEGRNGAEGLLPAEQTLSLEERCARIAAANDLTSREEEVLRLVCSGLTQRSIAESLVVSENTVHSHVKRIYRKLAVHNKQELFAYVNGL